MVTERNARLGIGSRRHRHRAKQRRRTGERGEIERLTRRIGKHGGEVRAIGRQFNLIDRRQYLLVLIAEAIGDVDVERGATGRGH